MDLPTNKKTNLEVQMYNRINTASLEEYKRLYHLCYRPYKVSIEIVSDVINIKLEETKSSTLELFMILTAMTGDLRKLCVLYNQLRGFKTQVPENLSNEEYRDILIEYCTAHEKPINFTSKYIHPYCYCSKRMADMYRQILKF